MTMQVTDPFVWNDEEWFFLGAENVYSLFDPEQYGLYPQMASTACYKGFIMKFRIDNQQLMLDELQIYCGDNPYPPVNGVDALPPDSMGLRLYKNINLFLPYSGVITIAKNLNERFFGRAFIGPHAYKTVFELTFENGQLKGQKETSGTYKGF